MENVGHLEKHIADGTGTVEAQKVLEIRGHPRPSHPGILHLYVHLMEMSPTPPESVDGGRLPARTELPDAGHLIHMPTHIDIQCGRCHDTWLEPEGVRPITRSPDARGA
jgi:hypothetical protein